MIKLYVFFFFWLSKQNISSLILDLAIYILSTDFVIEVGFRKLFRHAKAWLAQMNNEQWMRV